MNENEIRELLNKADFMNDLNNNYNTQNCLGKVLMIKLQEVKK